MIFSGGSYGYDSFGVVENFIYLFYTFGFLSWLRSAFEKLCMQVWTEYIKAYYSQSFELSDGRGRAPQLLLREHRGWRVGQLCAPSLQILNFSDSYVSALSALSECIH